jgi:hypothetical protein
MPILHILCCNDCLVIWTGVSLTTSKFKPLIFSMSGFTLSYTTNMFILMIPYDFCLFPAQFCYIIIYMWKVKSCVHITDRSAPWKVSKVKVKVMLRPTVQSASLSWNKAPIWGLRPDLITVRQLQACWCEALSLTRGRVCRLPDSVSSSSTSLVSMYNFVPKYSYNHFARTMHRKHTWRDRYPASLLARWLLPSNGLGTDLQKTRHVTATHCCVTSPRTRRKHCSSIVGRNIA